MYDNNLDRVYGNKTYLNTMMVRHDGTTVAFAMASDGRIHYSVLNPDRARLALSKSDQRDQQKRQQAELDVKGWNAAPQLLSYPDELLDIMPPAGTTASILIPAVKRSTRAEAPRHSLVPDERDPYLSTTARLTALVPIEVVSDGRYIYVFRQSIAATDPNIVYQYADGVVTADVSRTAAKTPIVDGSLLCDRFVLAGSDLKPVLEVRYQRSRDRRTPAAGGDTLGTVDMQGQPFYEPTVKLSFVAALSGGGFSVAQLPTVVHEVRRWQLFALNGATGQVESFNLPTTRDGLFSLTGDQYYTSPDPKYASAVLERAPGKDPNTGKPLVPVAPTSDRSGTAMRFDGSTTYVDAGRPPASAPSASGAYTFEAWVKPGKLGGTILTYTNSRTDAVMKLTMDGNGILTAALTAPPSVSSTVSASSAVSTGIYSHVAVTYDGTTVTLYLNGSSVGSAPSAASPDATMWWYLGSDRTSSSSPAYFTGDIDEVRVWTIARTDFGDRARRLTGIEPGLYSYYRCDEGDGTTVNDLTRNLRNATVTGTGAWVASDAPVGDGPGLARDVFTLPGLTVSSGLNSVLYFRQESRAVGYGVEPVVMKQQARLLLTFTTTGTAPAGRQYVSTLDFAVTQRGRLGQVPAQITLSSIGLPGLTTDPDKLSTAQNAVTAAQNTLIADRLLANAVSTAILQLLIAAIATAQSLGYSYYGTLDVDRMMAYMGTLGADRLKNPAVQNFYAQYNRLLQAVTAKNRLSADEGALTAAQDALATMTGGLQGGAESVVAMPLVGIDRSGLSAYGAQLNFAWTTDTPTLLDSSTGDVALYFRGGTGQFFAGYYATATTRAVKTFTVADGTVEVIFSDPAAMLSDITVTVTDGGTVDTCQVQIVRKSVTETFPTVPRAAVTFAQVLNGTLPPGALLGTTQTIAGQTITLAAPLTAALTANTAITVGGARGVLAADAAIGATTLTLAGGGRAPQAGPVRSIPYDYALATCSVAGVSLARGSLLISVRANAATTAVPSGVAADGTQSLSPRWRGNSPGRTLVFNGQDQYLSGVTSPSDNLTPTGDLTVEAWVNPATLLTRARVLHANLPASSLGYAARYSLGIEPVPLRGALQMSPPDCLVCDVPLVLTNTDFTVEMWVMRVDTGKGSILFGQTSTVSMTGVATAIGWNEKDLIGASWGPGGTVGATQTGNAWTHIALAFVTATNQGTLYINGKQAAQGTLDPYPATTRTILGNGLGGPTVSTISMDEVRVWTRARTVKEINDNMYCRVSGTEPSLAAYYTFPDTYYYDLSGNGHTMKASDGAKFTPVNSPLMGCQPVAGVGDQYVRGTDVLPMTRWGHVALTFGQDWAIALDGSGYLDAGGADGLNATGDMTIEVSVKLNGLGKAQGLVAKGRLSAGKPNSGVPYALYIQSDGVVGFAYETSSGRVTVTGGKLSANDFAKIAVIRKFSSSSNSVVSGGYTTYLYINGKEVRNNAPTPGIEPTEKGAIGNDDVCELGRYRDGSSSFGLNGTLTEVRIWNLARKAGELGATLHDPVPGLSAWWQFAGASSATVDDRCGGYPATVYTGARVRTPDPAGNRITLYSNGTSTATTLLAAGDPLVSAGYGATQFTVGGALNSANAIGEQLPGMLDEVRIWRTERTQEQILDNLYCRLREDRQNLLAYYSFDEQSTVSGATVIDNGLRGNNLTPVGKPTPALSTAPISDDTPRARSALAGIRTPFNVPVTSTPAASEYADMQRDNQGGMTGVMKRCYSYLQSGLWVLNTGFKVGDLITSWVSQAQFNPQLIGYIEGAPPVPSENLVKAVGSDYTGKSKVSFVQADNVTNTMSSSKTGSIDAAVKLTAEAAFEADVQIIVAFMGFGSSTSAVKAKATTKTSMDLKFSHSWTDQTQVSQSDTTTRTSEITLTGYLEDPANLLNSTVGQRWVPANNGFAIVQSAVGDLYSLRLAHSGAIVAYRMMPNPDIPPDWNIITFPINPFYTKQGTLDGIIGYSPGTGGALQPCADPNFPNAAATGTAKGEFSYYRPREAATLKRRIQREQLQLQSFYDSASVRTEAFDYVSSQADKIRTNMAQGLGTQAPAQGGAGDEEASKAANKESSRRNIVNTYAWTASGGLFSETTATTDQVTTTTTGELQFNFSLTQSFGVSLTAGPGTVGFGLDATMGAGYSATRSKSQASSRGYSLNVTCDPGNNLQQYDTGGNPVYDSGGKPVLAPGRVNGYRFNTFYLDTASENYADFFGKVIDPNWLATSTDSNAAALRQAVQAERKPPCWRIMHRVTYVSRVLPASASATPMQQAMLALGMDSDLTLIRRMQPYLKGASTYTELTASTTSAITANFPTLASYSDQIRDILAYYYDLIA